MRDMLAARPVRLRLRHLLSRTAAQKFEAKHLVFLGRGADEFVLREARTGGSSRSRQTRRLLPQRPVRRRPGRLSRTTARCSTSTGARSRRPRQETDTISRLVYGFASAYLLTGEDRFLEAAEKGTEYLREHLRFIDHEDDIVYWYHGIDVKGEPRAEDLRLGVRRRLRRHPGLRADLRAGRPDPDLPHHRRPAIPRDIEMTLNLFDKYYLDREQGGYFSHIDPVTLDPRAESLGQQPGRKNWNSVGDHAPAYLINLCAGHRRAKHADILVDTFDTIAKHFPDYDNSPFVQEKFYEDWSHDRALGLAAEPRGRRAQPEDRLEPDAHAQPAPQGTSTSTWPRRSPS